MPEASDSYPTDERAIQWQREREEIRSEIREMRSTFRDIGDKISDIHRDLAVGGERFKNQVTVSADVHKLEGDMNDLRLIVTDLANTVRVLRTIVFGGVGIILVGVLTALIGLVLSK